MEEMSLAIQKLYHAMWQQFHSLRYNQCRCLGYEGLQGTSHHLERYYYHVTRVDLLEKLYD